MTAAAYMQTRLLTNKEHLCSGYGLEPTNFSGNRGPQVGEQSSRVSLGEEEECRCKVGDIYLPTAEGTFSLNESLQGACIGAGMEIGERHGVIPGIDGIFHCDKKYRGAPDNRDTTEPDLRFGLV